MCARLQRYLVTSFTVIMAHFEHVSQGNATPTVKGRATYIVKKLRDFRNLRFLHFLLDLLKILSELSLNLQKSNLTCVDYLDYLESACLQLTELRTVPGENYRIFMAEIQDSNIYRGIRLTYYNREAVYDYANVVDLVLNHLGRRLETPNDNIVTLIQAARVFDIKEWPNTRDELAPFGNAEIQQLANHFRAILIRLNCHMDTLALEWALLKAHFGHRVLNNPPNGRPHMSQLFQIMGDQDARFNNIALLVEIIMVLPMSSSVCERGFSSLKRIKTDWRSRLTTDMMNHLLTISIMGPTLDEFVPNRALELWWNPTGGRRARRPEFQLPQEPDEDDLVQYILQNNN